MIKLRISSKGQVSVPKPVRQQLALDEGSELEVRVEGQTLLLRKIVPRWQRWRGALSGTGILQEHEREHREEIQADSPQASDA